MHIRYAELTDMDRLLALFKMFHAETQSQYGITFDEQTMIERIGEVIHNHVAWVLEENGEIVGMMGGVVYSMTFDKNVPCFVETTWFVHPEYRRHGMKLLKTAEEYCINFKIDRIIIGHQDTPNREKYEKVYGRKGYKLYEQHYIRDLSEEKKELPHE